MPPNVLILTTHDTGRFIQPYGITTVETPHLNRLAAEGARFNAYTTARSARPAAPASPPAATPTPTAPWV